MMKNNVRENIIEGAQKMFMRYGFRKTTMDEIAYAARKGKSSLYYYFKNKEEVFQAVMEKETSALKKEIYKKVNNSSQAVDKLRSYILVRMEGVHNWGIFYETLRDEYLSNYDFIERMRIKYDENEIHSLTQIIEEGVQKGEFKDLNADLTAKTVFIAMKGLENPLLMLDDGKTNLKREVDSLLNILFYGICA